ncbi:hypothetical protein Tco_1567229, partial [Tanacetum coccineum]
MLTKMTITFLTRDEVSDQHSYCFNVDDDPKTFDEAIKSQDVAFWKEAINNEMDSIMGNNTWVLADLPPGCKPLVVLSSGYLLNQDNKYVYSEFDESDKGVIICLYVDDMLIFGTNQADKGIFVIEVLKKFDYLNYTPMSTPMDTSEKLKTNNGKVVSQLEYSRVIGCLMYAMTCTRSDIAFAM